MQIPETPPDHLKVLGSLDPARLMAVMGHSGPTPLGKYHHWDTLRHLSPPESLTLPEWWAATKLARLGSFRRVPLTSTSGEAFGYLLPDPVLRLLHRVDSETRGRIGVSEQVTNPETRDRYLVSSLIEEAITSSQLEGASTTRKVAKDMLRTRRPPRNRDEQMILNNYRAMRMLRDFVQGPLTPEIIRQLQAVVTKGTLDRPDTAGRFRTSRDPEDDIKVWDRRDGTLLHVPPPADALPERMIAMCAFANRETTDQFIHPVVRAIILHFWLAYDHPFVDGNGRTARALFYWSMLSQGYWLSEFLSVSSIFRKAPVKYARAFLYTETDGGDLTYFLIHHLAAVCKAIDALNAYLRRKVVELRQTESLIRNSAEFNHRQIDLLGHALRHPGHAYTIRSHQTSHHVVYMTARSDLLALEAKGLLQRRRVGRKFVFSPPEDLADRFGKANR